MQRDAGGNDGSLGFFQQFVRSEVGGAVVLLAVAVAALVWANSPAAPAYFDLVQTYVGVSWGEVGFKLC